jgi:hypothetical protein
MPARIRLNRRLNRWSLRVLSRLEQAEASEPNLHFADDCRIAWITVLRAARGEILPQVSATYSLLGLHPDRVWGAIIARRKAQLGSEYPLFYDAEGNRRIAGTLAAPEIQRELLGPRLPPKKPVQSEPQERRRAA